jgi:3'(2'), 5'-bisphosphate nucleotidase
MYEIEQKIAIAAVTTAASFSQKIRHSQNTQTVTKSDRSPVTVADFGVQAIICQALRQAFPEDPVIGEEDATLLRKPEFSAILAQITGEIQQFQPDTTSQDILNSIDHGNGQISPRYWTLDPIDGTKGFIRGDQYAIALALIEQGEVKLGILGCPALPLHHQQPQENPGVIFSAVSGQGTKMISLVNDQIYPIKVNQITDCSQMQMIESIETSHSDRSAQLKLREKLKLTKTPLKMDSQAKYGAVARGEADFYLRIPFSDHRSRKENIWDHAAGAIVVTEAGGKVTDLDGKPLDFSLSTKLINNRGILATNGSIHNHILKISAISY